MTTRQLLKLAYRNERLIARQEAWRPAFTPNLPWWVKSVAHEEWINSVLSLNGAVTHQGRVLGSVLSRRKKGQQWHIPHWMRKEAA